MPTPLYRATDARILGSLSRILDIGVNDNTQNSQWGPGPAGAFDDYPADAAPSFQSIGLPLIVAIGIGILLLVALVVGYIKFIRKNPSPSSTTTENSPSDGNDGTLRRRKISRETRKQQLRNHFESYHVITTIDLLLEPNNSNDNDLEDLEAPSPSPITTTATAATSPKKEQRHSAWSELFSNTSPSAAASKQDQEEPTMILITMDGNDNEETNNNHNNTGDHDDEDENTHHRATRTTKKKTTTKLISNTCSICISAYEQGEEVVASTLNPEDCAHVFHAECAMDYFLFIKESSAVVAVVIDNANDAATSKKNAPCPCCRRGYCELPDWTEIIKEDHQSETNNTSTSTIEMTTTTTTPASSADEEDPIG